MGMGKGGEEKEEDKIVCGMGGRVVKIGVKGGEGVEGGEMVVVIEGMKMERK